MAHIGLLEDNARIAKLCTTFLQFAGHEVTIYEHPKKCLYALLLNGVNEGASSASLIRTQSPYVLPIEVLILDLSLPDIDGIEVMWQLQSQPRTRRLPLILCTAASDAEIARALCIAPQAAIVTKPFKLDTLISAISTALSLVAQ
ncbi:MAG: response regulator [Ktedonobacteraceae bacterium]